MDKIKGLLLLAVMKWPLPVGIAIGYIGHPIIKLGIDILKGVLG